MLERTVETTYRADTMKPTVGNNVIRLRNAAGLLPGELATAAGLSPSRISDIESDRYRFPDMPTLLTLAKALNCSIEDFLSGVDEDYERDAMARLLAFIEGMSTVVREAVGNERYEELKAKARIGELDRESIDAIRTLALTIETNYEERKKNGTAHTHALSGALGTELEELWGKLDEHHKGLLVNNARAFAGKPRGAAAMEQKTRKGRPSPRRSR